jgi:hypothetical protein
MAVCGMSYGSENFRQENRGVKTYSNDRNSSSSTGTTVRCGLWPVEQDPSIFFLSVTNSLDHRYIYPAFSFFRLS